MGLLNCVGYIDYMGGSKSHMGQVGCASLQNVGAG